MSGLKLSFLGPPQVELDGEPAEIGASKALALLAYLAVTGKSHSREGLSTLLWPDSDQSRGRSYLRHALWTLKQGIGGRWLDASREQIAFRPDEDTWLDVQVFQTVLAKVTAHDHSSDQLCPTCLVKLAEAVALYDDDFLSGFTLPDAPHFDEWQFFQAEELRQRLAGALEQLVQVHSARQEHDDATRYARRWLSLDPLHEPVHRILMRLYALSGQQAAALRQYQECVSLLKEELGVEPEEKTVALYEVIHSRQLRPVEAVDPVSPLNPGQRYHLAELLDTGAHGEVYLGRDRQTDEPVIVKRLRPEAIKADDGLLARFVQEGEALSQLNHPNIVRMLATFEQEGQRHLVMEHVAGGSLARRLQEQPPMALEEILGIALELADALSRAHHLQIIHRDVKPANVLLAADGTPRLTDFGVARLVRKEERLTATGTLLGTPAYMSPELLQGAEPDARSDIWSFGILLFEMLAGTRPFQGDRVATLLLSILNDPTPDIRQFRPDVSLSLADLLQRMLVKEPDRRLASMRLVAAELEAIGKSTHGEAERVRPAAEHSAVSPAVSEAGDGTGPAAPPPFVARKQELARLHEHLETALSSSPQVAFVLGEAGQGKTALLQTIARRAQELFPELIVAGGNCNAYTGMGDPYLPFREILALLTADLEAWSLTGSLHPDHARRVQRLLPETARALVEVAPDLIDTFVPLAGLLERTAAAHFSGTGWRQQLLKRAGRNPPAAESGLQQNALLESYSRLLQTLAQHAPLLLILDDLQWADPGSASLLFHLGRRLSACPVLIVGAYRPDEVAAGQEGEPHPLARVVNELQRLFGEIFVDLGQAEGQAFVNAWLDNEPNRLPTFFRQTLYRQTGGHPLFTIELLRAMQERGDLRKGDDGSWEVQTNVNWNTMPARVEGAIGERINRLEPSLQELLQVASVEGEEFTAEVVARALYLDERQVVRLLSRELDKIHALVYAIGTRHAAHRRLSRYRFRHILIQRYLYNSLDDVERIYQHEAVGRALEKIHEGQVAEVAVQLARHFELAQLPQEAAAYLHLAGDQARRTTALKEAIRFYQAARSHWPDGDPAGRAAVLRKLGECLWMTGQARKALEMFAAGYELFSTLDNIEEAGAMQRLIGRVYWELGERRKSLAHYRQALSILESLPESVELAWAISSISQMHMLADEAEEAIEWGERALTLARHLEAEAVIVHALNNIGTAYLLKGQLEEGRGMLEESIQRAIDGNLPHDACRGRLNLGSGFIRLDHYNEAKATYEALHNYANKVHTTLYITSSLIELSRIDWLRGQWRDALLRGPQIREWLEEAQSMAYSHAIAGKVFSQQFNDLGQPTAAYATLKEIAPTVRSFDELQFTGPFLIEMVRALDAQGEGAAAKAEASEAARELLDLLADSGYSRNYTFEALLVICDTLSTAAAAPIQIEEIQSILDSLALDNGFVQVPSHQAARHEASGKIALLQNNPVEAAGLFRRAVDLWHTIARPFDQARALQKLGETLLATGDSAGALDALTQGNLLIEQLAAQLDDGETKATFLQSPLATVVKSGLSATAE